MRALVQRVSRASVSVEGREVGSIGRGLLALVGVRVGDSERDARWIAAKVAGLRVFPDEAGQMNLAVGDVGGSVLVVSQFTLYADASRGRRPSFVEAARPEEASPLVDMVASSLREAGLEVACGVFGASMQVELVNEGPVTLMLESP